jgi:hypothetical protein
MLDAEKRFGHRRLSVQFGRFEVFGAKRETIWIIAMHAQVMKKAITARAAGS